MPPALQALPSLYRQAERLIELGVHEIADLTARDLRAAAADAPPADALLVVHHDRAPASALAPLLERDGKRRFVVIDMPDVDQFAPIDSVQIARGPSLRPSRRRSRRRDGELESRRSSARDHAAARTPLTLTEGIHWLLQDPAVLAAGALLHDDRVPAQQAQWCARCANTCTVDQQRHRQRWPGEPQRAEGRLVLGRQPPHLARLRLGRAASRPPGGRVTGPRSLSFGALSGVVTPAEPRSS